MSATPGSPAIKPPVTTTGSAVAPSWREPWPLRDLVFLAVLGTVFGFLYYALVQGWGGLQVVMGPSGDLAQNVLYGGWIVVAPLAAYVIRRPGAGILAEILAAFVEFAVLGSPFGPGLLLAGLIQGAGTEVVFALTRYRRWSWGVFVTAGASAGAVVFVWQGVTQGWFGQDILLARLGIHLISCVLLAGVMAKAIGDGLLRTGVLDQYAIGRAVRRGHT